MARGLDHVVHAVRDLDGAAEFYRRAGFTVGARNRHPWGTHNQIVQLPGFFIELLTVAEPDKLGDDGISELFGKFNRDFLAHNEGLPLLILESQDAQADANSFAEAGIAASEPMRFERDGKRPDGATVKLAFSLTFAANATASAIGFATCQQHYPENFWNPAFQSHANGALGIAGVVMVAGKPADHRFFLSSFSGVPDIEFGPGKLSVETPRGEIAIMDPVGFRSRFGSAAPATTSGIRLAAIRLTVADLDATEALLRAANVAFAESAGQVVIGAAAGMGATLVFEAAAQAQR
jgi:hypothetical protein